MVYQDINQVGPVKSGPVPMIAIVQGKLGRYTSFELSMDKLRSYNVRVTGTYFSSTRSTGLNPAEGRNNAARTLLANPAVDCVVFFDDDHEFDSDTVLRLCAMLHSGWDLAAPLIVKVEPPFQSVAWQRIDGKLVPFVPWGKSGVHEMDEIGTGILAVKRRVFETVPAPWFQLGQLDGHPDYMGEDVFFARAARAAGFRIGLDVNFPAGHTAPFTITPDVANGVIRISTLSGKAMELPIAALGEGTNAAVTD